MKKLITAAVAAMMTASALAIPAQQRPYRVAQPDGDSLTVNLQGDEFYHYLVTTDGYTVAPDATGAYTYQYDASGTLRSTGIVAHDAVRRTPGEQSLLLTLQRNMVDAAAIAAGNSRRALRDNGLAAPAGHKAPRRIEGANFDLDKFKGLIILINFTDKKFTNNNAFYNDMINKVGYTGFIHNGQRKTAQGSMRDYFNDQSNGKFKPTFDIYGPVDVNHSCTEPQGSGNSFDIFADALKALDSEVDFSKYDTDNDGYIDMVYFIVAGYSANYSGNNSDYLWPHAYYLVNWNESGTGYSTLTLDGRTFWRYACSTEIYGWESRGHTVPLGIGTMCHEFSHVLGFPDLYDTNYATDGQSVHPDDWDLMAGGSNADEGRRPVGYSLWERSHLGFASPKALVEAGHYELRELQSTQDGYILPSPNPGEYFLFENRALTKWDSALPGKGMLVTRVETGNQSVWDNNTVNANAKHNYYELLHADGRSEISAGNAFPGTANVTKLGNHTTPNLMTWDGSPSQWVLSNIKLNGGIISFDVAADDEIKSTVEDFETMETSPVGSVVTDRAGRFSTWDLTKAGVVFVPSGTNYGNGDRVLAMIRPSTATMTLPVEGEIFRVTASVYNSSSTTAKLRLYYSVDGGTTWKAGDDVSCEGKARINAAWSVSIDEPVLFRLGMIAGGTSTALPTYVDDFTIHHNGDLQLSGNPLDVNGDGEVNVGDVNAVLNIVLAEGYDDLADVNGDGMVNVGDVNIILNAILSK